MGERARRRARFFEENLFCCFCGGHKLANEIDHQPPKIFFLKKSSPYELRVPSCSSCNRNSSPLDQNLAFYSRFDVSGEFTEDFDEMSKMINALHNNYPTLKPFGISNKEKRATLRRLNSKKSEGVTWSEVPVVGFNENVSELLKLSLAKLGVSFFYLHSKKVSPVGTRVSVLVERDILLNKPVQLEAFDLNWTDFLQVKNPNKMAQKQIGVKLSVNKRDQIFVAHMRLNKAILATVILDFSNLNDRGVLKHDYVINEDGFPWGEDISALLKGEPDYTYYGDNG